VSFTGQLGIGRRFGEEGAPRPGFVRVLARIRANPRSMPTALRAGLHEWG
jgi:hypothetical protein